MTTNSNERQAANLRKFKDEMGDHPLGECVDTRAVGPYVLELYRRVFGYHRRRREGMPERGVVSVHERVPEDEEHFRDWRNLCNAWIDPLDDARDRFKSVETVEDVRELVEEYGDE